MHTSFKIDEEWHNRVKNLISGSETVSLFCYKAMEERVRRMEARDSRSVKQNDEKLRKEIRKMFLELKEEGAL